MATEAEKLRIIFAGTPEFAATTLEAILDGAQQNHHEVIAVYTQPDRPAGRGKRLTASPVKQLALNSKIPIHQPHTLKSVEDQQIFLALDADLMIVVAYGLILPKVILDGPRLGCLNVHASILPRWRGAAPIQRAIAAGDSVSGITIMQMDEGLDTGDMLLKKQCIIDANATGEQLHDQLAELGAAALIESLKCISQKSKNQKGLSGEKQNDELATYAHKLSKNEASIQWDQPTQTLHNLVRAFNSWPVATTKIAGKICRIWNTVLPDVNSLEEGNTDDRLPGTIVSADKKGIDVITGDGMLRITRLQLEGGKELDVAAILNSKKDLFQPGHHFDLH